MSIYKAPSIEQQPYVNLTSWRVFRTPEGDCHFCGRHARQGDGRVSSKIVSFDKDQMIGVTRSGRIYHLVGDMGANSDAQCVASAWMQYNGIDPATVEYVDPRNTNVVKED